MPKHSKARKAAYVEQIQGLHRKLRAFELVSGVQTAEVVNAYDSGRTLHWWYMEWIKTLKETMETEARYRGIRPLPSP